MPLLNARLPDAPASRPALEGFLSSRPTGPLVVLERRTCRPGLRDARSRRGDDRLYPRASSRRRGLGGGVGGGGCSLARRERLDFTDLRMPKRPCARARSKRLDADSLSMRRHDGAPAGSPSSARRRADFRLHPRRRHGPGSGRVLVPPDLPNRHRGGPRRYLATGEPRPGRGSSCGPCAGWPGAPLAVAINRSRSVPPTFTGTSGISTPSASRGSFRQAQKMTPSTAGGRRRPTISTHATRDRGSDASAARRFDTASPSIWSKKSTGAGRAAS